MNTKQRRRGNMFLAVGTFVIVVLMLILGFIAETVGGIFHKTEESTESSTSNESYTELASA